MSTSIVRFFLFAFVILYHITLGSQPRTILPGKCNLNLKGRWRAPAVQNHRFHFNGASEKWVGFRFNFRCGEATESQVQKAFMRDQYHVWGWQQYSCLFFYIEWSKVTNWNVCSSDTDRYLLVCNFLKYYITPIILLRIGDAPHVTRRRHAVSTWMGTIQWKSQMLCGCEAGGSDPIKPQAAIICTLTLSLSVAFFGLGGTW